MQQQAIAVLRERRVAPHVVIHRKADEPAVQQIDVQLLHQQALAADAEQHLDKHRAGLLLRRDRWPAGPSAHRIEGRGQLVQGLVDDLPDVAKRVQLLKAGFEGDVAGDGVLVHALAAQRASSLMDKVYIMGVE